MPPQQQFVPAGYGFYGPPVMHGAPVSAGFPIYGASQRQNGPPPVAAQGSSGAGMIGAGTQVTQQAGPQPAAGSWPMQMTPVVNPFLVSF